jgi:hypothetical protein
MDEFYSELSPIDFLQGSRGLIHLREIMDEELQEDIAEIQTSAMALGKEVVADQQISYEELVMKMDELEKAVELLQSSGNTGAERLLVYQFVLQGRQHSQPAVVLAVNAVHTAGTYTIKALRDQVKTHVPATKRSGNDTYLARAMSTVTAYFASKNKDSNDSTVKAFMTLVNKDDDRAQKRGYQRDFTREEDKAHIKKQYETIKKLRAQNADLKAGRGEGGDHSVVKAGGWGRGRGRGRGSGRGSTVNVAESSTQDPSRVQTGSSEAVADVAESAAPIPSGSAAAAFEAFRVELVDNQEDSTSSEEVDSGNQFADATDDVPGSEFTPQDTLPDPPYHPPQIKSRRRESKSPKRKSKLPQRESPESSVPKRITPLFLVFGLILYLVFLIPPSMIIWVTVSPESYYTCTNSFSEKISTLAHMWVGGTVSSVGYFLTKGRSQWNSGNHLFSCVSCGVLVTVILLLTFPSSAHSVDIQVPGGPTSLLYTSEYMYASPLACDFLDQRAAVLNMVTQGDTSVFDTRWCVDGGANRHVHDIPSHFKNFKSIAISVHVAKKGAVMQAIGVGDVDLHCVDNMGNPCVLPLKDVLCIPEANKSLVSVSMLAKQGYQCVYPCPDPVFPPGVYQPRRNHKTGGAGRKHIPFQCLNDLYYLNTRNDLHDESEGPLTRSNKYLVWCRKLGHCSLEVLRQTRDCVVGLEDLAASKFPRNYIAPEVKIGKLKHAPQPALTGHVVERCMSHISWDTAGPTKTKSINGFHYTTVFVDHKSMYYWVYGHNSTAQIPELFDKFYADTAPLRDKHGPILCVRRDRASVNISAALEKRLVQLSIRSETSNSYEPWQNNDAERAIQTLSGTARTVMQASGLLGRFWFSAFCYAAVVHNVTFSVDRKSSPYLLMHGVKPDISNHQQFGVEGWIYRREDQLNDTKFDARGEPCIFVGYPSNQKGYLVWCPARGPNAVVSTTNVFFGLRLPRATRPVVEIIPGSADEIPLPEPPSALTLVELHTVLDPRIVGTYQGHFVVAGSGLEGMHILPP